MTQRQGWHVYNYGGRGFAVHYYRESGKPIKLFEAACGIDVFRGGDDLALLSEPPTKGWKVCKRCLKSIARAEKEKP